MDKPKLSLILHNGSPVCPRGKPSLSLGQSRGRRAAESLCPVLPFLGFSVLPRKNLKITKDFLSLPNPQILGKERENTKITKEIPC